MDQRETYDVVIVGSGPAGATYARTIGEAAPQARVLMVEVGPVVPGSRGDHTQNLTDEERAAAQLLTQGPDAGVVRAQALSDIAPGIDPSLEFRQTILPGLFFVNPRPALEPGEVGLPAASMASGVGGMGIHWGTSSPRPQQSERIPFIADEDSTPRSIGPRSCSVRPRTRSRGGGCPRRCGRRSRRCWTVQI